jgi:TonB family protein
VRNPRRSSERRFVRFLAVALVVHAEIALLLGVAAYLFAPRDADVQARLAAAKQPDSIDIGMVDEEMARRILADLERQEEERKAEEIKKEVESIKAPGQVVDVPVPREEKRPAHARFASEHDTTVERETRKYGKFDPKARAGDASGTDSSSRPEAGGSAAAPPPLMAMRVPRPTPGADPRRAHVPSGGQLGSANGAPDPGAPDPEGSVPTLGKPQVRPGSQGASGGAPMLVPSAEMLARSISSGTTDALRDIDEGDDTALNSKKWKFASFFNRVKRQVEEQWHPAEVYRKQDPTGAVYGRLSRLTIVRVQLKPDGKLANLALEQPSGLEFLDDEALQAFRLAQPFPNPPRQLVDANDGLINFRFGFFLDLSGVSRPYLFKYPGL